MTPSFRRAEWLALLAVLVLGVVALPQPFGWDQSLFAMGARALHEGGALYRDFWDVKQPGIFLFYWLGGALFGFHEAGIHLFELLWSLGLAALAIAAVRRDTDRGIAPAAAALFTSGFMYAVLRDWHLTQVESIAGLPLFVSALATLAWSRPGGRTLLPALASGLAAGVATLLKVTFLPIAGAFWLAGMVWLLRGRAPGGVGRASVAAAGLVVGFAAPWLAVVAWLAAQGTLAEAWNVWTVYPVQVLAQQRGFRLMRFADSAGWFVGHWAPLLGLGAAGLVLALRRGSRLAVLMGGWFVVGLATLLVQRWSYWQYHFVLLATPAGVLAALGLGELHAALAPWLGDRDRAVRRLALGAGLAALFLWPIGDVSLRVLALGRNDFALTRHGRRDFQEFVSSDSSHRVIRREVAFLSEPGAIPGPVYVIGNPLFNWESGRRPGAPRHGAVLPSNATAEQWEQTTAYLRGHPPAYVAFERGYFERWTTRPELASFREWLHRDYRLEREGAKAAWWARKDTPP